MVIKSTIFFGALVWQHTQAFSSNFINSTLPTNSSICNSTLSLRNNNLTVPADLPHEAPGEYKCIEVWPSDLTVVNSRYPDYASDHLHQARQFFMLRRQRRNDGEIATRVQFQGLPSNTTNTTCRLEFILPRLHMQIINGPNPTFNIYQVEREAGSVATWNSFTTGREDRELFGIMNGERAALNRTRSVGGVAAINQIPCNQTMTFQMEMRYDGLETPNYWEFLNVRPPAWPVQGFRMVYGC